MTVTIDLYYWPTPNGRKITVMLEELETPYQVKYVNIKKGEQFHPAFLWIAPNGKIPAIVDHDGPDAEPISIFESGAILQYLGRKFQRFYPSDEWRRTDVDQWLFWQMANLGPMAGQANHFRNYAEPHIDYAVRRYADEVRRLYGVMNRRLAQDQFLAVNYSIADIACFGWIGQHANAGLQLEEFPNVQRWFEVIGARPAVLRAIEVGREERKRQKRLARDETPYEKRLQGDERFRLNMFVIRRDQLGRADRRRKWHQARLRATRSTRPGEIGSLAGIVSLSASSR